jgi:excisionase family DNA binding protein
MRQTANGDVPVLLIRPEDAAIALGVSRTKVYELMASGRISSLKIGRSRRIPVDALTAFVSAVSKDGAA